MEQVDDSLKRSPAKTDRTYVDHDSFRERHPGPRHGTWWRNDTPTPMSARFFVGPPQGADPRARREMLTWKGGYIVTLEPGQPPVQLPREWDGAVQTVDSLGRVVSGRLPRARRVADPASGLPDPPPVELHPALDDARTAPVRRRRRPGGEP